MDFNAVEQSILKYYSNMRSFYRDLIDLLFILAFLLSSLLVHLWRGKKIISFKTAKWVSIFAWGIIGIPVGLGLGWLFSLISTLFLITLIYITFELSKRLPDEKKRGE